MTVRPGRLFSDHWETKEGHFQMIGTTKGHHSQNAMTARPGRLFSHHCKIKDDHFEMIVISD